MKKIKCKEKNPPDNFALAVKTDCFAELCLMQIQQRRKFKNIKTVGAGR
ncbi:MAG: hypothetical protein HFE90_00395 [Firmicutes bacterium]|nr:hypothetical protein [Bacillota bacterium]